MDYGKIYDEKYYASAFGELPYEDKAWFSLFEKIADRIIEDIHPKTVLDVGCAMGYLVAALRDRGVMAYGIDVSEYAISKVREDIKPYCKVASALEHLPSDFPVHYDLAVTIEVIEHLYEEDCELFLSNICTYADDIIFSSSPDDLTEETHFNVQQREYWAKRFAKHNFYHDLSYDASYIAIQTTRFLKKAILPEQLVEDYERKLRGVISQTTETIGVKDEKILELTKKLSISTENEQIKQQEALHLSEQLKTSESNYFNLLDQIFNLQNEIHLLNESKIGRENENAGLKQQINELQSKLNEIYGSRCYRLILKYYRFKYKVIPKGSKRFFVAKIIFKTPAYISNGYIKKILRYIRCHGFRGIKNKIKDVVRGNNQPVNISAASPGKIVSAIKKPVPTFKHAERVDIIICVHNAYEDVKRCIESVFEYTTEPYHIIIVDDGSSTLTKDYLADIAAHCNNVTRIRNEQGNGYTIAANMGLKASNAPYCILLNSDTIVTENWLDKMIHCMKSDEEIGIVGPLSNTASWQSVPILFDEHGDWCHNVLPENISVEAMGKMIQNYSGQVYMQVPLLNGFCLMIHRKVINTIGYLDEKNFGKGFGEEDDYNLRAYQAGFKLAIADDTYIYHAQSKSYTDEKRLELCKKSEGKVRSKHSDELVDMAVHWVHKNYILEGIRHRSNVMLQREALIKKAKDRWEGKRILFILPIADAGGGANVIIQEACVMQKMGIDVWLYNIKELKPFFECSYPHLTIPVLYGNGIDGFRNEANKFDVICSTLYSGVKHCDFSKSDHPPLTVYYIQDFEPCFFETGTTAYKEALESYTKIKDMIKVTKTNWNANLVQQKTEETCSILGPSVNIDLFRPRKVFGNHDKTILCAMVRPESQRRAPMLTMEILSEVKKKYGDELEIIVFGFDEQKSKIDSEFLQKAPSDFSYQKAGKLCPEEMAALLATADIFADFSSFQAMGLTAMEAMASGCSVIVPQNGGTGDFVHHEENCIVIDTLNKKLCIDSLCRLIEDKPLRNKISYRAIGDMCYYYPEKSAYHFLDAVFGQKGAKE